ncbi:hypothetical protein TNCV_1018511 [Trichonephila clavipes]|nr:hypothetical protein TNCV_1018511 [Trichonephila clavipes]
MHGGSLVVLGLTVEAQSSPNRRGVPDSCKQVRGILLQYDNILAVKNQLGKIFKSQLKQVADQYKMVQSTHSTSFGSSIPQHILMHVLETEEINYKYHCNHCSYKSNIATNFRNHLRRHSGEKPFKCEKCYRGFTTKQNMLKHLCYQ